MFNSYSIMESPSFPGKYVVIQTQFRIYSRIHDHEATTVEDCLKKIQVLINHEDMEG